MLEFKLVATCTDGRASVHELRDMYDTCRQITRETFFRHVSREDVAKMLGYNYRHGPMTLTNEGYISYYRGRFKGRLCYRLVWSAIDHIFCKVAC